ncbi:MAG TPA: SDR family NAD(P)-dependent oxidoreductase [Stellaceae bacterium]|nr:SDR family NAD(P)-dependent oxidoreductase [Stellaceae bacterium]
MGDYSGCEVVVTGGTGALGRAVVKALLDAGATCRVPYIHAGEAESFPFKGDPRVKLAGPVDLADEEQVAKFYAGSGALWASIHLAGGFAMKPIAASGKADFQAMTVINLLTCQLACAAAVKAMKRAGKGGRIVNVAARTALEPRSGAGMTAYAAAKAAVAAFTQALAAEVAGDGIWVNAVAPSIMDTPANRASMPKADCDSWPKVEEVAAAILFLASPGNRVTSGAIVPVYGKS